LIFIIVKACKGSPLSSLKKFQAKGGDSVKKLFEIYLKIKLVKSYAELVRAVADLIRAMKSR